MNKFVGKAFPRQLKIAYVFSVKQNNQDCGTTTNNNYAIVGRRKE